MITIYKYQFLIADTVHIEMPEKAKVLSVDTQNNTPFLWAMVNTEWVKETRKFYVAGTGNVLTELWLFKSHLATIQLNGYVWHIFE